MLGIIRCRTLKCKRNLPKRDRFILVGFIWGNVGTRRKGGGGPAYDMLEQVGSSAAYPVDKKWQI